jgi:glycosyltransferase involved in cell wall biosynthesis
MIFRAIKLIRERRIEVLYYFSLGSGTFIGPLAGIGARVPVIIREVQTILHGLYPRMLRGLDRLLMSRVSLTLTPSHFLKKLLVNELGLDSEKIEVIPNAINLDKFGTDYSNTKIRTEMGLNGDAKIVGMIANLLPVKAHSVLLEAVPCILQSCPETHFLFIGEGPLRTELMELGKKLDISSHLHFLGYRNDVEKVIPAFRVGVLCSWVETYGIALTEMMAAGVPVVATNVGGIPEVVDHGKNGFLVEPGNAGQLAKAIASLLTDESLASRLGTQAREKALTLFSKDHMIRATESVLLNT